MEIDHSKLPRRVTPRFVALQALYAVVAVALFIVFRLMERSPWPAGLEATYTVLSASAVALVALAIFPIRSWFDPTGLIYGFIDDRTAEKRRLALRSHTLMYLILGALFAYLASLFIPECALRSACINFSEAPSFTFVSRSVLPVIMIVVLGQSVGNGIAFAIAWLRS